jgi:hypothetical protein
MEERASQRGKVRGGRNIIQSQGELETMADALAIEEAETKERESQSVDNRKNKEEIQVLATEQGSEESIPETHW